MHCVKKRRHSVTSNSLLIRTPLLILLQPLWWRCVDCVIHHERDVREE